MNGTTQPDDNFSELLRAVFHWPLYLGGDDSARTHVDCDYCGITLWVKNSNEQEHYDTNLDVLYKAVSAHMPDCAEGTPENSGESP